MNNIKNSIKHHHKNKQKQKYTKRSSILIANKMTNDSFGKGIKSGLETGITVSKQIGLGDATKEKPIKKKSKLNHAMSVSSSYQNSQQLYTHSNTSVIQTATQLKRLLKLYPNVKEPIIEEFWNTFCLFNKPKLTFLELLLALDLMGVNIKDENQKKKIKQQTQKYVKLQSTRDPEGEENKYQSRGRIQPEPESEPEHEPESDFNKIFILGMFNDKQVISLEVFMKLGIKFLKEQQQKFNSDYSKLEKGYFYMVNEGNQLQKVLEVDNFKDKSPQQIFQSIKQETEQLPMQKRYLTNQTFVSLKKYLNLPDSQFSNQDIVKIMKYFDEDEKGYIAFEGVNRAINWGRILTKQ